MCLENLETEDQWRQGWKSQFFTGSPISGVFEAKFVASDASNRCFSITLLRKGLISGRSITSFNLQARFSQELEINVPIALAWSYSFWGSFLKKNVMGSLPNNSSFLIP